MSYLKSPLFGEWMFKRAKKSPWKLLENVPQKSLKKVCHDLWEPCLTRSWFVFGTIENTLYIIQTGSMGTLASVPFPEVYSKTYIFILWSFCKILSRIVQYLWNSYHLKVLVQTNKSLQKTMTLTGWQQSLAAMLWPRLKVFKSRSNFKVTRSNIMVPCERYCHKEYTWNSYLFCLWKLWPGFKIFKSRSNFQVKVIR